MTTKKKIEIIDKQIEKLGQSDLNWNTWLSESKNLLALIFEKPDTKQNQLEMATKKPTYFYLGLKVEELIKDWKSLMESFKYELELTTDNSITKDFLPEEFVHNNRIAELKELKSERFDFSKLIEMCIEINSNYSSQNFLSVAMLGRAIIDHVSPIFNFTTFIEVANNYGTKSFKKSMNSLNLSMRSIADNYLHSIIRKKESLPNKIQIDFKSDLDVLLAEIIRVNE